MRRDSDTRREFLRAVGLGAAATATQGLWAGKAQGAAADRRAARGRRKPNILLIIADDQTWRDNGCYGHSDVKTPNIDALAAGGMRFTRAFTATAMCAPTRQQLYTGLFPVRNGAYPNHSKVYPGTKSIVHHLKALGYRVGLLGKKHFGPPESFPFESVAKKAMAAFVTRDREQPFCLVYCSHSPHLPWSAGDASAYDPEKLTLPPYLVDTPETRRALCKYYAEITDFDREVGECTALLRDAGSEDNTIFLYTSEQGAQMPHGKWTCYDVGLHVALVIRWPARVKAGSVARAMVQYVDVVPTLIEAAGGAPKGIDTGRPDAASRRGFDGRSFLNVLLGKTDKHNDVVYGAHTTRGIIAGSECYPVRSIRTETHKYIWNPNHETAFHNVLIERDSGKYWSSWVAKAKTDKHAAKIVGMYEHRPAEELYDLRKDPFELNNLAGEAKHAELKASLRRKLEAWMKQQGDEGNATEMKARERQGRGRKKKPRAGGKKR